MKRFFFHWIFCCSALAACSAAAQAETVFVLYLGSSRTDASDVQVNQPSSNSNATFRQVDWDNDSFKLPPYYGLRINHFFENAPAWGMGFEFTHDKVYAQTHKAVPVDGTWNGAPVNTVAPMSDRVQSFSISHGVNTLAVNVYYRWLLQQSEAFPHGRWQPYLGGGPSYYVLHAENTVNGVRNNEGYKGADFGYQLLGGLHYGITSRIGIFAETKYNSGKIKVDTGGGGNATTDLRSLQVLGGLSVAF